MSRRVSLLKVNVDVFKRELEAMAWILRRIWLTDLNFKNGLLLLSGKALSNNLIADLINNLQTSNSFANVKLKSSSRIKETGIDIYVFKLECVFVRQPDLNKVG